MSEKNRDQGEVITKKQSRIKPPRLYRVILHNDDYTTMDFVVMILKTVFHKSDAEAVHIMLTVHHAGNGVAGVYSRELAETRVQRVLGLAREHQHPLKCSMEPET